MILNEWEDNEVFESENEWEDNGEIMEGPEDTRPTWAKRIQGYRPDWAQIDRIKKVVGKVTDDANVSIAARPVRMGDRNYTVDVYLEGVHAGTYSY